MREAIDVHRIHEAAFGTPIEAHGRTVVPVSRVFGFGGSAAELGAAVAALLGDEGARRRQAAAARDLVGRRYSSGRLWAAYESIYTGLVERRIPS